MDKMDNIKIMNVDFLDGKNLIKDNYIGSGEVEEHNARFRLFGINRVSDVEVLFGSPDVNPSTMSSVLKIIFDNIPHYPEDKLNVYFDLDEEMFVEDLNNEKGGS